MKLQAKKGPPTPQKSQSHKLDSPIITHPRKRGSWPARQVNRISLQQKAILIDEFFVHSKKIKDVETLD